MSAHVFLFKSITCNPTVLYIPTLTWIAWWLNSCWVVLFSQHVISWFRIREPDPPHNSHRRAKKVVKASYACTSGQVYHSPRSLLLNQNFWLQFFSNHYIIPGRCFLTKTFDHSSSRTKSIHDRSSRTTTSWLFETTWLSPPIIMQLMADNNMSEENQSG